MSAPQGWRTRVSKLLATATAALVVASGIALAPTAASAEEPVEQQAAQIQEVAEQETPTENASPAEDVPAEEPAPAAEPTPAEEPAPAQNASPNEGPNQDSTEGIASAAEAIANDGAEDNGQADDAPVLTVEPTTGLSADGDTITISGRNFDSTTKGTHGAPGTDAGVYVQVGWVKGEWRPSAGGESGVNRDYAKSAWVRNLGETPWTDRDSGSFEVTFDDVTRAELEEGMPEGARLAVFTTVAGGATAKAEYEFVEYLEFAGGGSQPSPDPEPDPEPQTGTSAKVTGTNGGKLTVTVTSNVLPKNISGAYVALIEKGKEGKLDPSGGYLDFVSNPFPTVKNGTLSEKLVAPNTDLDRNKKYEVIIWKIHTAPEAINLLARADVDVTTAQWDTIFGVKPTPEKKPTQPKREKPVSVSSSGGQQAGSLTWSVSRDFIDYVTNKNRAGGRSGGKVTSSGVGSSGGAYTFPQASSSWNKSTQTGSIQYSGVVTLTAHGGELYEAFNNPRITVNSATSATMTAGDRSFRLNLGAASKSVNSDGTIAWSGVPVAGSISGSGPGGGGSFSPDPLSFTVGSASSVRYGSTTQESDVNEKREPAPTAPTTEGITVITPEDEIVAGEEIEFEAAGFEPGERDILVVMYSEPIVLDEQAGANDDGVVRWIGTLPEDETGEHTITLQGSKDAGAVIDIVDPDEKESETTVEQAAVSGITGEAQAAGIMSNEAGVAPWVWWMSALGLLVVAGGMTGLVIAQRRQHA